MKPLTIIKCVCMIMFFIIAILNVISVVTYWRNAKNQFDEDFLPLLSDKVFLSFITPNETFSSLFDRLDNSDDVLMKYGIIRNCKLHNVDDCPWPDKQGFVGDNAITFMLGSACGIYVLNILVMLLSMCCRCFPRKGLFILSLTCILATFLLILGVFIYGLCCTTYYFEFGKDISKEKGFDDAKKYLDKIDVQLSEDSIIFPYPLKISYAEGFYINCVAAALSLLPICAVCFASYKRDDDENANLVEVIQSSQKYPQSNQYQQQAHPSQSQAVSP